VDVRDRALVLVLLKAGLRVGSAVALDVEDVQGDRLVLRTMKNGDEGEAFLPPEVARVLAAYVGDRTSGPLFEREQGGRMTTRQVARRIDQWAKKAGILGRVSPHRLRHAFAMGVYERTQDAIVVARALGHRSLHAVAVYTRPSERRVRDAVGA
jgi:integrase/recombinase XerC